MNDVSQHGYPCRHVQLPTSPTLAPVFDDANFSDSNYAHEYSFGIVMVSRRIEAALLCLKTARCLAHGSNFQSELCKPIAGWTDGSGAGRAAVHGFSSPINLAAAATHSTHLV